MSLVGLNRASATPASPAALPDWLKMKNDDAPAVKREARRIGERGASDFTIFAIHTAATCWRATCIPKTRAPRPLPRQDHARSVGHVVEGLQENAVALVDDAMAKALQKRASEVG